MKGLLLLPIGALALAGYVYAGSKVAQRATKTYETIKGNGKVMTQNRKVGDYHRVVIGSSFEGQFFETTPGPLTISAESNLLPMIVTEVRDGTLYVETKGSISTEKGFRITGRATKIDGIEAGGASKIELKGIKNHALDVETSGASELKVFGSPSSVTMDVSGASKASFGTLNLSKLVAKISGASTVQLSGTAKTANIDASGASRFDGSLSGDTFRAVASGASTIAVKGRYKSSHADSTGASSITKPN